jgi:hypothetical protein
MTIADHLSQLTLAQARGVYFEQNGFGADGGYGDAWVTIKLGPFPFPLPNTPARVRAVRYHDLHHIVTGYDTSLRGEMEIGAWEIASGCRSFPAAWHLNLSAMGGGVLVAPRRTLRAYARGRRSQNLYSREFSPELLALPVQVARRQLSLCDESGAVTWSDLASFVPVAVGAISVGLATLVVATPLALAAWPSLWWAHRRGVRAAGS